MIRVLVVDDHPAVRNGIASALAGQSDVTVVATASSAGQALQAAGDHKPDIALLELGLPGTSGVAACRELCEKHPRVRTIALTGTASEGALLHAFAAGARGIVVKQTEANSLGDAMRVVLTGGVYVDPRLAGRLVRLALQGQRATGPFGLSVQEMRVLERLPRGLTNKEIGRDLRISENTVKSHVRSILRKLDATDRAAAAAVARRHGLG